MTTEIQTVKTSALLARSAAITEKAASIQVVDDISQGNAVSFLGNVAKALKAVTERRRFFVDPLNAQVKAVNGLFAEFTEPLEQADKLVRGKVLTYQQQEQQRAAAERQAALAAAAVEDVPVPKVDGQMVNVDTGEVVEAAATTVRAFDGQATFRERWTFEVTDPTLVPDTFKMVKEKAIGAAVKSGVREIAGVRIYSVQEMAVTGK